MEQSQYHLLKWAFLGLGSNTPDIVFEYFKKFSCVKTSRSCSICFQTFKLGDVMMITPCTHFYHETCLKVSLYNAEKMLFIFFTF